jgi:hypothetical protein
MRIDCNRISKVFCLVIRVSYLVIIVLFDIVVLSGDGPAMESAALYNSTQYAVLNVSNNKTSFYIRLQVLLHTSVTYIDR